jgi:multiple sugar transport system substrate-binding protein
MKKKLFSLLLCGLLVAGATSCGSETTDVQTTDDTENTTTENSGDETAEGSDLTGKTVTLMAWWDGGEQEAGKAKVEACQKELGCTIDANYIPYDEYLSKLNTLAAAQTMPDVFALPEGNVFDWGDQGMLLDLAPVYEDAGVDLKGTYIEPAIFQNGENVWAVGYDITTLFLYYNKEMFDNAGIEYPPSDAANPWTWDEYVDAAKKLTTDSAGLTPNDDGFDYDSVVAFGTKMPTAWTSFLPLLRSNGVGILTEDGSEFGFTKPEAIEVFQAIADLSAVEQCAPTAAMGTSAFSDTSTMLMNGQLGMLIDGGWAMSNYVNESFDVGVAAVPIFDQPADIAWTCGFCVSADTKDAAAAVEVHKWFTDFTNYIDACETAGVALGGIPQTYSVYDDEEYMQKWATLHSEDMVEAANSVLNAETTVLGDNVRVKNFPSIVDDTLIPQLDKVWYGEMTAEEAMSTMNDTCAQWLEGYWN